jgi:hypothetical protein
MDTPGNSFKDLSGREGVQMKFTLEINCDTPAFKDPTEAGSDESAMAAELRGVLESVAHQVSEGRREGEVIDSNGAHVGRFKCEGE